MWKLNNLIKRICINEFQKKQQRTDCKIVKNE